MSNKAWAVRLPTKFHRETNFLQTILNSYGIVDIPTFLAPTAEHTHDPFLLRNIEKGLELFHGALGKKIFIKVDPDADGLTSATYMRLFIERIAPETQIDYKLDFGKRHGFFVADIEDDDYDLIIVPDASGEVEDYRQINSPILVLDHHPIKNVELLDYCTMINCKDGQYPNAHLTGVGVVHKFVEAYCQKYLNENLSLDYLDLVAVGMVADMEDMTILENRYYALSGIQNVQNLFLSEMVARFEEDMPHKHLNMTGISWTIAPLINGVTRYGKPDEQVDLYRALCGEDDDLLDKPRKSKNNPEPEPYMESLQARMTRVCRNVKGRQDKAVRDSLSLLRVQIEEEKLDKNKILIVSIDDAVEKKTVKGLIANKLASEYMRPTLVVKQCGDVVSGSGRGYGNIKDFKSLLQEMGLVEKAEGHESAFGITIPVENVPKVIQYCNKNIDEADLQNVIEVDYEIPADMLNESDIYEVAQHSDLWGSKQCEEPTFAITGIRVGAQEVSAYGTTNNFIRFMYNGIRFVKKYCKADEFDEMVLSSVGDPFFNENDLVIDVIGQCQQNEWEGNTYYEIKILHFWSRLYDDSLDFLEKEERVERETTPIAEEDEEDMSWLFG